MAGGFGAGVVEGILGSWQQSREKQDEIKRQKEQDDLKYDALVFGSENASDDQRAQALDRILARTGGKGKAQNVPNGMKQKLIRMVGASYGQGQQQQGGPPQAGGATGTPPAGAPSPATPATIAGMGGGPQQGQGPVPGADAPPANWREKFGPPTSAAANVPGGPAQPVTPAAAPSQPAASTRSGLAAIRQRLESQLEAAQRIPNFITQQREVGRINQKLDELDKAEYQQENQLALERQRSEDVIKERNAESANKIAEDKSRAQEKTVVSTKATPKAKATMNGMQIYENAKPWENVYAVYKDGILTEYRDAPMTAADSKTYNEALAEAKKTNNTSKPTDDQIETEWNKIQDLAVTHAQSYATRPEPRSRSTKEADARRLAQKNFNFKRDKEALDIWKQNAYRGLNERLATRAKDPSLKKDTPAYKAAEEETIEKDYEQRIDALFDRYNFKPGQDASGGAAAPEPSPAPGGQADKRLKPDEVAVDVPGGGKIAIKKSALALWNTLGDEDKKAAVARAKAAGR